MYFLVTNFCLGRDVCGRLPTTVVLKLYTKICLHALHLLLFSLSDKQGVIQRCLFFIFMNYSKEYYEGGGTGRLHNKSLVILIIFLYILPSSKSCKFSEPQFSKDQIQTD